MNSVRAAVACLTLGLLTSGISAPLPDLTQLPVLAQVDFPLGRTVNRLSFSPDGQSLLSVDGSGLSLWSLAERRLVWRHGRPAGRDWQYTPSHIEWEDRSVVLTATADNRRFITRVDRRTGKVTGQEKVTYPDWIRRVIAPGYEATDVWMTEQLVGIPAAGKEPVQVHYAYSAAHHLLAFGHFSQYDDQVDASTAGIQVYSQADGRILFHLSSTGGGQFFLDKVHLGFSPDGHYLALSEPGRVTIWEMDTGQKLAILRPHPFSDPAEIAVQWDGGQTVTLMGEGEWWLKTYALPDGQLLRSRDVNHRVDASSPQGTVAWIGDSQSGLQVQTDDDQTFTLGRPKGELHYLKADRRFISLTGPQTGWLYQPGAGAPTALRLNPPMAVHQIQFDSLTGFLNVTGQETGDGLTEGEAVTARVQLQDALKTAVADMPVTLNLTRLRRIDRPGSECPQRQPTGPNRAGPHDYSWPSLAGTLWLCRNPYLLTAWAMGTQDSRRPLWQLPQSPQAQQNFLLTEDDRFLLRSERPHEIRIYRTADAALFTRLIIPELNSDVVSDFLVSPDERLLILHFGDDWHFYDVRTQRELPALPDLKQAEQLAFVDGGATLAAEQDSAVVFYALR